MRISDEMKDLLIGFPVVLVCAIFVIFLLAKLGPTGLIVIFGLIFLGFMGGAVGSYIRENFRVWK